MLGTPVSFFLTSQNSCPSTIDEAQSPSYLMVTASQGALTLGPRLSGGSDTLSTSFYIQNGWQSWQRPPDFGTSIQLANPAAIGGGCWSMADKLEVSPCSSTRYQRFFVWKPSDEIWNHNDGCKVQYEEFLVTSTGPYTIADVDLGVLTNGSSTEIIALPNPTTYGFCIYNASSGNVLLPPTITDQVNVPTSDITNLTGASIPSDATSDIDLPGCTLGNNATTDTIDCIVSRTLATLPLACFTDMNTRECVLHVAPAFCLDLPEVRFELGDSATSDAVENCLYGVRYGPCVANPSGAACTSGLFIGIVQFNNGGHSSAFEKRRNNGPLFGDYNDNIPLEDQFWSGISLQYS